MKKQTRRETFLEEMEDAFLRIVEPAGAFLGPQGGRPPYPPEAMLRIHLMQNWYSLSERLWRMS